MKNPIQYILCFIEFFRDMFPLGKKLVSSPFNLSIHPATQDEKSNNIRRTKSKETMRSEIIALNLLFLYVQRIHPFSYD